MSTISSSFTATATGGTLHVRKGESAVWSVSGTFVATVILERAIGGPHAWATVDTITEASSGVLTSGDYRFRCSAFTSGTAVCVLADHDDVIQTWTTPNGPAAQVDQAGLVADKISEMTSAAGVTVDGVLLKDGGASLSSGLAADTIGELTEAEGVTVDGVLLKDGGATLTAALNLEDSDVVLGTDTGSKVGTAADQKLAFFGADPVVQPSEVGDVAITYTANDPSIVPDGAVTVADGSAPTVAELLELVVEVNNRLGSVITALQNLGLMAVAE